MTLKLLLPYIPFYFACGWIVGGTVAKLKARNSPRDVKVGQLVEGVILIGLIITGMVLSKLATQ